MNRERRQAVLSALGKTYSAEILAATDEPRSAQELSDALDIPIATCYRRLKELAECGLLDSYSESPQQEQTYARTVDSIYVDFDDDVSISITRPTRVQATLDKLWKHVR